MRRLCSVLWLSWALAVFAPAIIAKAQIICVSNNVPPPDLPVYEQPPIPAPGYLWIPGYWAGGPTGYFWVPATWILPPAVGLLWTPGYWSWHDGIYLWTAGYWGPHVGFYGGINYGFGYTGVGYEGGRWENGVFAYNRTVNNFGNVAITNVYEKTVVIESSAGRVSFNGGSGGTTARSTPQEEAAARGERVAAIPVQFQHERFASANKALLASENHGRPPVAATAKAGEFAGKGVVAAREVELGTMPAAKPTRTAPVGPSTPGNVGKEERARDFQKEERTRDLQQEERARDFQKEERTRDIQINPNSGTPPKPLNREERVPKTEAKLPNVEAKPPGPAPSKALVRPPPPNVATAPRPRPRRPNDDKKQVQ